MKQFHFTKADRASVFEMLSGLDWAKIADYLRGWKNATRGYLTFHRVGKLKSPEQLGYYHVVILPEAFNAFKNSGDVDIEIHFKDKVAQLPLEIEAVDLFLKVNYGKYHGEFKHKGEMTKGECAMFEDWCIRWLAKWMNCHVPPADPNWREKALKNQEDV
jgi:hypothetical protein